MTQISRLDHKGRFAQFDQNTQYTTNETYSKIYTKFFLYYFSDNVVLVTAL